MHVSTSDILHGKRPAIKDLRVSPGVGEREVWTPSITTLRAERRFPE